MICPWSARTHAHTNRHVTICAQVTPRGLRDMCAEMFVNIIVATYERISAAAALPLDPDHLRAFREAWKAVDPHSHGRISLHQLPQFLESLPKSVGYDPLDPSEEAILLSALRLPELPNGKPVGPLLSELELDLLTREWTTQLGIWESAGNAPKFSLRVGFEGTAVPTREATDSGALTIGCGTLTRAVALKPLDGSGSYNNPLQESATPVRTVNLERKEFRKAAHKAFKLADEDKSGSLDEEETRRVIQELSFAPGDDFDELFDRFDPDNSGTIDTQEFEQLYLWMQARAAFQKYDTDGNGRLDRKEANEMLQGISVWTSDIDVIFKMFDKNGDGDIDVSEYMELYELVTTKITVTFHELLYAVCERKVGTNMPRYSAVVIAGRQHLCDRMPRVAAALHIMEVSARSAKRKTLLRRHTSMDLTKSAENSPK